MASFGTNRTRDLRAATGITDPSDSREFILSMRDRETASNGLKLADEMLALLATIDREDARRLIKLVRDLLDTLDSEIGRPA